jgi:hypothetical protein
MIHYWLSSQTIAYLVSFFLDLIPARVLVSFFLILSKGWYCGVAPKGRSIERPLLINGYAYLAISLPDNGHVDSNS